MEQSIVYSAHASDRNKIELCSKILGMEFCLTIKVDVASTVHKENA